MATTPVTRGRALKLAGAAPTTTKLLIDAKTFRYTLKDYSMVTRVGDNNSKTATYVFQDAITKASFEATTISGQTAPGQGDLITLTFPDNSTVEMLIVDPVEFSGYGEVERGTYKLEKPEDEDLSP